MIDLDDIRAAFAVAQKKNHPMTVVAAAAALAENNRQSLGNTLSVLTEALDGSDYHYTMLRENYGLATRDLVAHGAVEAQLSPGAKFGPSEVALGTSAEIEGSRAALMSLLSARFDLVGTAAALEGIKSKLAGYDDATRQIQRLKQDLDSALSSVCAAR